MSAASVALGAPLQSTSQSVSVASGGEEAWVISMLLMSSWPDTMYLQCLPTASAHSSDHCLEQYIMHFSFSHSVMFFPLCGSAAQQLLMQRFTNSLLQTLEYFSMQTELSKLASFSGGQDSQSLKRVEPGGDTLGPARSGLSLSGHLVKSSQPSQKSPGLQRMHSGTPRKESSILTLPKQGDWVQSTQHLK